MRDPWDVAFGCRGRRAIRGGRVRRLIPADADTVAAATASATLRQAFGRASTVVEGQPLGLPGQKVAGHAPVPDRRQARRYLVVHRLVDGT